MMTKSEMEMLISGMGEMFREYLASFEDYQSQERFNAEMVLRHLLAWLEKDGQSG